MRILVVNGPNLNFLGIREKEVYGDRDYFSLVSLIEKKAAELNIEVEVFQSNGEGEIIDRLQKAYNDNVDGILLILQPITLTAMPYGMLWHASIYPRLRCIYPIFIKGRNLGITPLQHLYVTDR